MPRILTASITPILLALLFADFASAQAAVPLQLTAPVQDKNFYVLTLIQRTPAVRQALSRNTALARITASKRDALAGAPKSCELKLDCYTTAVKFSEEEIAQAGQALRALQGGNVAVRQLVEGPLHASGTLLRYERTSNADILAKGWVDCARGINRIIDVYGAGSPKYPDIDSISFDAKTEVYRKLVQTVAQVLNDDAESMELFFEPSLRFALALMDANHRDEAGRLEPLESGENEAALKRISAIAWDRFPYSVIVVPGSGTDRLSWSLSPYGKLRVQLAAKRFREGKAPFILVSGGFVHPSQTPYAEALEMKKSLMADFGIPADAILVDPHARHTTTNMRNAARIMYRDRLPFDKKGLVTTDPSQSSYIEEATFAKRCVDELGYVPYKIVGRMSSFDLEFLPVLDSLQINPLDPLDP